MLIVPAVDILNGCVVRLVQGDFRRQTVYDHSPFEAVALWLKRGAPLVHVVDLNAVQASVMNSTVVFDLLRQHPGKIQIAGGVRSKQRVQELLQAGAARVVIGSSAARLESWVQELLAETPASQLVLALDVYQSAVKTEGWNGSASHSFTVLLQTLCEWGGVNFLITDIERDGTETGANVELYTSLVCQYPNCNFIASGGVSGLHDLEQLRLAGVREVVVGRALYAGKIRLEDVLKVGGSSYDH